jgi:hypothetical protein
MPLQPGKILTTSALLLIAIWLFLYSFLLSICICMSNNSESPEISLALFSHPTRTLLLVGWLALSWFFTLSLFRFTRLVWVYCVLLSLLVIGVGTYFHGTSTGHGQAFSGTGPLRRTTGLIDASSGCLVLILLNLPPVRRRFFNPYE